MSSGDKNYKMIRHEKGVELPRTFLDKAEHNTELSNNELSSLISKQFGPNEEVVKGEYTAKQLPRYGVYNGGDETEYLCQLFSIDKDIPFLSPEEIAKYESGQKTLSSSSLDGFLLNEILRYNFEKQDWENAPEHIGRTAGQEYFFCDTEEALEKFFDKIIIISESYKELAATHAEPEL